MDKKILFIGDSWVTNLFNNYVWGTKCPIKSFWIDEGFTPYFLGDPSRDTQTIIDLWIKCIPHLTPDDLLVIFLPVFNRTRLPLNEKESYPIMGDVTKVNSRFRGAKSYNPKFTFLEIWGNEYSYDYFSKKMETQELINGSNASILNYIEIIDSLCKITPCKKLVHCWDYKKHDSEVIVYRDEMTELVGMWETRAEIHRRTNGEQEMEGDSHWSDEMNLKFMDFLKKHFSKKYKQKRLI
jgi:hypothetical protein